MHKCMDGSALLVYQIHLGWSHLWWHHRSASALPHPRPATCTLAGLGLHCSTGCMPRGPAASSSWGWRTPTRPDRHASPRRPWLGTLSGWGWTGMRVSGDDEGPWGNPAGQGEIYIRAAINREIHQLLFFRDTSLVWLLFSSVKGSVHSKIEALRKHTCCHC